MNAAESERLMARLIRSAIQYHPELIYDLISVRINKPSWTMPEIQEMNRRIDQSDKTVSKFLEDLL